MKPILHANEKEMKQYHELQDKLSKHITEKCEKCPNYNRCYYGDGSAYHTGEILSICPNKEIKQTIRELYQLDKKAPNALYYAITGKWFKWDIERTKKETEN